MHCHDVKLPKGGWADVKTAKDQPSHHADYALQLAVLEACLGGGWKALPGGLQGPGSGAPSGKKSPRGK